MKKIIIITTAIVLQFITFCAIAQTNGKLAPLTFTVNGFADNSGQLLVYMYRKDDKIPSDPFKLLEAEIKGKQAFVQIEDLLPGEYACIFVHDQNANNHIDHSFGIPNEPLGYTNNWKLTLFSGMPTFEKLRFTYSYTKCNYVIDMDEE